MTELEYVRECEGMLENVKLSKDKASVPLAPGALESMTGTGTL